MPSAKIFSCALTSNTNEIEDLLAHLAVITENVALPLEANPQELQQVDHYNGVITTVEI
jgi:hypothetical protein